MAVGNGTGLREAPARLLSADWLCLVEMKGSREKAIDALSRPDPSILVHMRRQGMAEGIGGCPSSDKVRPKVF